MEHNLKTRLNVLEPGCAPRTLATWDLSVEFLNLEVDRIDALHLKKNGIGRVLYLNHKGLLKLDSYMKSENAVKIDRSLPSII
jgi:hypothetical protein